ncbi:MAG: peptide chain release factor N(5)-glutamine methyltransferase [candidate division Zixibacteria bacterium]|nr:peptide chain release factor N(5)-glutamine methyltransferase [candidate division Zixibacteria bacterium]
MNKLISSAGARLQSAGIESGAAEAEIVLCYLLKCERLDLFLSGENRIDDNIKARFEEIISKRETRYPLQYILGEVYFYGRRFSVDENVMVPTPETELLCENALRYIAYRDFESPAVLDVGCGSGVIAVTTKLESPGIQITALDLSGAALQVAQKNAGAIGARDIVFIESDMFDALDSNSAYDLILANPPYISDGEYDSLPPEVKADPRLALTSGEQGLDIIKRLLAEGPKYLNDGGKLMFEIGCGQAELIRPLIDDDDRYVSSVLMKDLNDIDRIFILSV